MAASIAAACAPALPVQPTASRPPGSSGKASPRPSAPGASATLPGSPAPSASAPASAGPTGPTPSAAGGSPAVANPRSALADLVANKLLNLAKVGFNQSRSELASTGDTARAGLIGNNAAGVISNNAGSLLSDKGLGLVANNGGSVVANNGGSVVANNGGGLVTKTKLRLLQATALPTLPPRVEIATTAEPGETLTQRRVYPDGTIGLRFTRTTSVDPDAYRLIHMRDGKPFRAYAAEVTERWPNGKDRAGRSNSTEIHGDGSLTAHVELVTVNDEAGKPTRISVQSPSYLRDEASGAGDLIEELVLDFATGTGTFRFVYPALGMVETGMLTGVRLDGTGRVLIPYWDPLATFDGTATAKVGEVTVYTRTRATAGGTRTTTYDLADGIGLTLTPDAVLPGATAMGFEGRLSKDGVAIAQVRLDVAPSGTATFTATFDDDPTRPLVVGFGVEGAPTVPTATPRPETATTTLLGRAGRGFADGLATLAKFGSVADLAASRKKPNTIYIVDGGNHRVRVLDQAGLTVGTLAGDGVEGYQDGPAASARFSGARSLAVAADDTIYVSEATNPRIRAIAGVGGPNPTVSTLAGSGTKAFADGTGAAASFNGAGGFALDDATGALYVADYYNHRIRRVGTQGPDLGIVTTVAGTGTAGLADGPGAAATFNGPLALAIGPDGDLYVADTENRRIRRIDLDDPAHPVTTVVGTSDPARQGMDGAALETGIEPPRDLLFDAAGRLIFASVIDVRRLEADGQVRTLAGNGLSQHADGPGRAASFSALNALMLHGDGTLFIGTGHRASLVTGL